MNNFVERFLLPLFVFMSMMYAFHSFGNNTIQLTKVYHHKANNPTYLEIANIVFYFSAEPQLSITKENQTFFFPGVSIATPECERAVQQVNKENNGYKVHIKSVTKPHVGIQVTFVVDNTKCALSCESFNSINLQKGIVFRIYNKDVLHKLEEHITTPILKTASLQKPCIVIDPGHGGRDKGTMGVGIVSEKQVCLAVGTQLAQLLEGKGYSVLLTRKGDYYVPLDKRTSYAHEQGADLFVSIHANYAQKSSVVGVETFCSASNLFTYNYSGLSHGDQCVIKHLMSQRMNEAYNLACVIQKQVCNAVTPYHVGPVDRKVKHAASQVLLGAQMPSVLIEIGFLSNKDEARLLSSFEYQSVIAHAICNGIISFLSC